MSDLPKKETEAIKTLLESRIDDSLISIIPEDMWNEMVDKRMDHFLDVTAPEILDGILKEKFVQDIRLMLVSGEWTDTWNSRTGEAGNAMIHKMLVESAPQVFAAMLEPMMTTMLQNFRNSLSTSGNGY